MQSYDHYRFFDVRTTESAEGVRDQAERDRVEAAGIEPYPAFFEKRRSYRRGTTISIPPVSSRSKSRRSRVSNRVARAL